MITDRYISSVEDRGNFYSFRYANDEKNWNIDKNAKDNPELHQIEAWIEQGGKVETIEREFDLKAYAKQKRKELEEGGFDFNGLKIATDPDSQRKILGARVLAESNPDHKVQFNYTENEFVELDAPLIIALSTAVAMHIDRMFKAQSAVIKAIDESNIIDTDQVDNFFKTYGV